MRARMAICLVILLLYLRLQINDGPQSSKVEYVVTTQFLVSIVVATMRICSTHDAARY